MRMLSDKQPEQVRYPSLGGMGYVLTETDDADPKKNEDNFGLNKKTYGGWQDYGCLRYMITPGRGGWSFLEDDDLNQPM